MPIEFDENGAVVGDLTRPEVVQEVLRRRNAINAALGAALPSDELTFLALQMYAGRLAVIAGVPREHFVAMMDSAWHAEHRLQNGAPQ